jgi:Domain of unknown function (DUF4124)
MKKIKITLLTLFLMPNIVLAAGSDIYKYKDEKGNIIYTDKMPINIKNAGILSKKTGVVKNLTELEQYEQYQSLTPEEKEKIQNQIQAEAEQMKKDEVILKKYSTIEELEKLRNYEVGQLQRAISNDNNILEGLNSQKESISKTNKNSKKTNTQELEKLDENIRKIQLNKEKNEKMLAEREQMFNADKERLTKFLNYKNKEKVTSDK